ncbi:MAG TPA: hypothetical protein VF808_02935 [Ktedonobacterales bacterium]
MDRMYRATLWLSMVGVGSVMLMIALQGLQGDLVYPYASTGEQTPGMVTVMWLTLISSVAAYCSEGAALVAVALAWADRRQRWMGALGVASAVAILTPLAFTWLMNRPDFQTVHPRVSEWLAAHSDLIFLVIALIPAALGMVFAWRGAAGVRQAVRAQADETLEITRSPL